MTINTRFGRPATGAHGLTIRHYGDPVLKKVAVPIDDITPELRGFADAMVQAMYDHEGIGLAAPQVGRSVRMIVIDTHQSDEPLPPTASLGDRMLAPLMPVALINLEILEFRGETRAVEEGCLSFPKIYGEVSRPERVVFKARLLDGSTVQAEADGLLARCLQHELDHLDGILFPERMSDEDRETIDKPLTTLYKSTRKNLDRKQ